MNDDIQPISDLDLESIKKLHLETISGKASHMTWRFEISTKFASIIARLEKAERHLGIALQEVDCLTQEINNYEDYQRGKY